jgi:hypothetical protein
MRMEYLMDDDEEMVVMVAAMMQEEGSSSRHRRAVLPPKIMRPRDFHGGEVRIDTDYLSSDPVYTDPTFRRRFVTKIWSP